MVVTVVLLDVLKYWEQLLCNLFLLCKTAKCEMHVVLLFFYVH